MRHLGFRSTRKPMKENSASEADAQCGSGYLHSPLIHAVTIIWRTQCACVCVCVCV
jgi:hypothetical protein